MHMYIYIHSCRGLTFSGRGPLMQQPGAALPPAPGSPVGSLVHAYLGNPLLTTTAQPVEAERLAHSFLAGHDDPVKPSLEPWRLSLSQLTSVAFRRLAGVF